MTPPAPHGEGNAGGEATGTQLSLGPTRFFLALDDDTLCYLPLQGLAWVQRGHRGLRLGREPPMGPGSTPRPRAGALSPEFLGLVCTRACRLACRYCGFGATEGSLQVSVALAAVDWFLELCAAEGRSEAAIELFGGEPMHTPELVEAVALRAWRRAPALGLRPALRLLTSGVGPDALRDLVADLFAEVTVSIDGPPELHDRLRPLRGGLGSFAAAAATAERVAAGQASLSLRTCVTAAGTARMAETARFLLGRFHPSQMAFEPLHSSERSHLEGLRVPDPVDFVRGFLEASPGLRAAGTLPVHSASALGDPVLSFCPVARDGCIVSPGAGDGEAPVSACYLPAQQWRARGLELQYGRFAVAEGLRLDPSRLAAVRAVHVGAKPRCRSCFVRFHCAGACHVHHSYPGAPVDYDDTCRIARALAYAELLRELGLQEELTRFAAAPWDPAPLAEGGR